MTVKNTHYPLLYVKKNDIISRSHAYKYCEISLHFYVTFSFAFVSYSFIESRGKYVEFLWYCFDLGDNFNVYWFSFVHVDIVKRTLILCIEVHEPIHVLPTNHQFCHSSLSNKCSLLLYQTSSNSLSITTCTNDVHCWLHYERYFHLVFGFVKNVVIAFQNTCLIHPGCSKSPFWPLIIITLVDCEFVSNSNLSNEELNFKHSSGKVITMILLVFGYKEIVRIDRYVDITNT